MGPLCSVCGGGCPPSGCQKAAFQWAFGGDNNCFLYARLGGVDVQPLDMCSWLYCHETDTRLSLIPNGDNSYLQYASERDISGCNGATTEPDKIFICDLLGLGKLSCLGDVAISKDEDGKPAPQPCDVLVYSPFCGDEDCPSCHENQRDKWVNYHIPDAGNCVIEPDADGYIKVLTKDACGCIKECKTLPAGSVWHGAYGDGTPIRDGVWVDADWPSYYGSWHEDFQAGLATRFPDLFGKFDLEVDVFFRFQIVKPSAGKNVHVSASFTPYIHGDTPDLLNRICWLDSGWAIVSGTPEIPWGTNSKSGYVKRIVPKGKDMSFRCNVLLRTNSSFPNQWNTGYDGQKVTGAATALNSGLTNHSKFYDVRVFARPVVAHKVPTIYATPPANTIAGAYEPPHAV